MTVAAFQQPSQPAEKTIVVDKIKDNLYVLKGGGGNTAVFITDKGVVVVDTKNPGWGQPILDKIKTLTDKPVTTIINTHTHGDHVSGNVEFPATVDVITQENTKTYMEQMQSRVRPRRPTRSQKHLQAERRQRPAEANVQGHDDDRQREPIRSICDYFGRGAHRRRRVRGLSGAPRDACRRHDADTRDLPIMDRNNGGTRRGLFGDARQGGCGRRTSTRSSTAITRRRRRWPTCGSIPSSSRDFVKFVQDAKKAGKTVDDVVNTWKTPAKYTGYSATPSQIRVRADAQVIWDETQTGKRSSRGSLT